MPLASKLVIFGLTIQPWLKFTPVLPVTVTVLASAASRKNRFVWAVVSVSVVVMLKVSTPGATIASPPTSADIALTLSTSAVARGGCHIDVHPVLVTVAPQFVDGGARGQAIDGGTSMAVQNQVLHAIQLGHIDGTGAQIIRQLQRFEVAEQRLEGGRVRAGQGGSCNSRSTVMLRVSVPSPPSSRSPVARRSAATTVSSPAPAVTVSLPVLMMMVSLPAPVSAV